MSLAPDTLQAAIADALVRTKFPTFQQATIEGASPLKQPVFNESIFAPKPGKSYTPEELQTLERSQLVCRVVEDPEKQLPAEILQRADARHGELAWRPSVIPAVIEAARQANLVGLGGDLQIRAPSGKWGEPVGFGIDTARVSETLSWNTQVEESAKVALAEFQALRDRFDFKAIAAESFPALVAEVDDASDVIFFGWWVQSRS